MLINLRPTEVQYLIELLEDDDSPFSSDRAKNGDIIRVLRFSVDTEIPPHHRRPQRMNRNVPLINSDGLDGLRIDCEIGRLSEVDTESY